MLTKTAALAVAAGALALLAAACSSSPPKAAQAASTHSASASSTPTANPTPQLTDPNGETCPSLDSAGYCGDDDPLTCSTVVDDTGYKNGPLTELRAIAFLDAVLGADLVNVTSGNASNSDLRLLDAMASDMENYHGSKLSDDAEQFYSDEQSYNPGGTDFGPEDTSYATAMEGDILTLDKDCPGAVSLGKQMLNG